MKITSKHIFFLGLIFVIGNIYTASFFHLNDVIKVADSFAYFQMSHFLKELSIQGFGNGWFGFLYSLPIAIVQTIIDSNLLAARIVNLIFLNIGAILLWKISRKILSPHWSYFVLLLFFIHPTLLHFRIHILSENVYIPLFLGLFLASSHLIENIQSFKKSFKNTTLVACLIGLMYLTRAEAFIYIGSIGIIATTLLCRKRISLKNFFSLGLVFFLSFFIFISPYLFFLHDLTGEWGLTNKGASNLRQAELRGQERMDDNGFERAVAELTEDKHHLIAGFAGGMPYDKPNIEGSLGQFISKDPSAFVSRVFTNQIKLYSLNGPELFLGKSPKLYYSNDARFSHIGFALYIAISFLILLYGVIQIFLKEKSFGGIIASFFIPASIFFTLFFTLNRYFLIFIPFLIIFYCYGISQIPQYKFSSIMRGICSCIYTSLLLLSAFVYYNVEAPKDEHYSLKKEAGIWLSQNVENPEEIKIMERFPIVTYYSTSKTRYITPYTFEIGDIYEYGLYHDIDFLIADSMDFQTYRPQLSSMLDQTPANFEPLMSFSNDKGQKVILYQLKK